MVRTEADEYNFDYDRVRAHIRCERTSDNNQPLCPVEPSRGLHLRTFP